MSWALVPQDAATLAVPFLSAKMPDCTVSTRVEHRERMVYVQQVGGNRNDHVLDSVLLIVQTYSKSVRDASKDCREAFTHLLSIRDDATYGRYVRDVESFALPGRNDDSLSSEPRYQATVQISLRPLPMEDAP